MDIVCRNDELFSQNDELFKVMFLPQSSLQICHMIWIQTLLFGIECECRFGLPSPIYIFSFKTGKLDSQFVKILFKVQKTEVLDEVRSTTH